MIESALAAAFRSISEAIWSHQQQKLLYDLAEGSAWSAPLRDTTLDDAAQWLSRELSLECDPTAVDPGPVLSLHAARKPALDAADRNTASPSPAGREVDALAPLVGAAARTLANQLVRPSSRARSIRWAQLLGRLADERIPLDAWLYHQRTPAAVARQVFSWSTRSSFDVGDELLALSLLALWQRRRPTREARSNRGRSETRTETAKPIALLLDELITDNQRDALVAFAVKLDGARRRALLLLVIEVVLTEAHARSHKLRAGRPPRRAHQRLNWVESLVRREAAALGPDVEPLRYRVAVQRAYGERAFVQWNEPVSNNYVRASLCVARHRASCDGECACSFEFDAPGVCMLLPQLRAKGRIET